MSFGVSIGGALLALALAALPAVAAQVPGDPVEGKRLAVQWCGQCHAVGDTGAAVPDAGPPFAALADDPATSESAMRGFLHDPQPPMPPLELSGRQIDHILAYIASLKTPEPPGDVAAGRGFAETHCARCHAVGIEGDSPFREAPPFREFLAKWQPEYLAEAFAEGIVVGHPAMPAFELNTEEIDDLLAYLETLKAR